MTDQLPRNSRRSPTMLEGVEEAMEEDSEEPPEEHEQQQQQLQGAGAAAEAAAPGGGAWAQARRLSHERSFVRRAIGGAASTREMATSRLAALDAARERRASQALYDRRGRPCAERTTAQRRAAASGRRRTQRAVRRLRCVQAFYPDD